VQFTALGHVEDVGITLREIDSTDRFAESNGIDGCLISDGRFVEKTL